MKETKLKRLIKKMMDSIFLDAMTPEFKAANAELLKAIKMNDKSGAVPHADLEAVNKAMKENDADKAGQALKKVQLQLSKAEKALDDEVKDVNARLADAKHAADKAKQELKAKKALEAVFEKAKSVCDSVKSNPKNASKLTALTDKLRDYGDLSKRASQIVTLSSSGKDASKQIDMLRKSIDTAEKKYKKGMANIEKEAKKAKDALEVMAMRQKVTQGKRDAFQKERLYLANAVKQTPGSSLAQNENSRTEIDGKLNSAIQEGKKLYEQIDRIKETERKTYAYETKIYKQYQSEQKSILKNCKDNLISLYREMDITDPRIERNVKSAVFDDINKLDQRSIELVRKDLVHQNAVLWREEDDASTQTKKNNIKKNYDIIGKMINKIDEMNKELWQSGKKINKLLENEHTFPYREKSERIKLFNRMLNKATEEQRVKIVELLHKFGQPSVTKPAKDFEEFKKWMMIGAERIKNDIV